MPFIPPSETELKALVEEFAAQPLPDDITGILQLICASSQLGIAGYIPKNSRTVHYILLANLNGAPIPVALIPLPGKLEKMLEVYDGLLNKSGSAAADPEYKGVMQ